MYISYLKQNYITCFKGGGGLLGWSGRGFYQCFEAPSSQISLGQLNRSAQSLLREGGEADGASGAVHPLTLLRQRQQPLDHNGGWWAYMGGTVASTCRDSFIEQ